jgi:hypothetical protein
MRRIVKYLLILLLFNCLFETNLKAQQVEITDDNINKLKSLIERYLYYYTVANSTESLPLNKFKSLFNDPEMSIPRDFPIVESLNRHDYSITQYNFIFNDVLNNVDSIEIPDVANVLYCMRKDCWYTWIEKQIYSKPETGIAPYITFSRLKIIRNTDNTFRINEITLVDRLPTDKDRDHIADSDEYGVSCDKCNSHLSSKKINFILLTGCEDDDGDDDGVKNDEDRCKDLKGPRSNHGCPDPPSSRVGFSITGGLLLPLSDEFNNGKHHASKQGWNGMGYYTKWGFMVNPSFHYNVYKYLGINVGFIYSRKPLDGNHLSNQISYFLGNNGVIANNVTVSSLTHQLFMPYVGFQVGNLNSEKSFFSIEPLIGLTVTDIGLFNNNYKINMMYQNANDNGSYTQTESISYKSNTMPFFGGKLKYELRLGEENVWRFKTAVYYLSGPFNIPDQSISFPDTEGKLIFTRSDFRFLGISTGFYFNIR